MSTPSTRKRNCQSISLSIVQNCQTPLTCLLAGPGLHSAEKRHAGTTFPHQPSIPCQKRALLCHTRKTRRIPHHKSGIFTSEPAQQCNQEQQVAHRHVRRLDLLEGS